jgi:hypothetical protein
LPKPEEKPNVPAKKPEKAGLIGIKGGDCNSESSSIIENCVFKYSDILAHNKKISLCTG